MTSLALSAAEARRFLVNYHFHPQTVAAVFDHLGSVQYDPLNPVGQNHDLVLQSRVPDYQVGDWTRYAYEQRRAYDAWDKQACLVPMADWPLRALGRRHYRTWHDRDVLREHPAAVADTLAELDRRGPLSSLDFSDKASMSDGHSWLGPTRIKRILRALSAEGILVTHHRQGARHYYDRPERVIPPQYFQSGPLTDLEAYHRWIVSRRSQSAGILRPGADQSVWSSCGDKLSRQKAIAELVEGGELIEARIGEKRNVCYLPAAAQSFLQLEEAAPKVRFLAPLDNLLWDRRLVADVFGFDYVWEVYKPESARRWGYYVIPVMYSDRFVARFESRLQDGDWVISGWWWEKDVQRGPGLLDALAAAGREFRQYLGAKRIAVPPHLPRDAAGALRASRS
ncbi:MAG: DNA glycosylase AlkZ-like family protein [Chloroflexota bacterium]